MKAEDTVMSDEEMLDIIYAQPLTIYDHSRANRSADSCKRELCEAQSQISFEAGMKEVVEWVEKHIFYYPETGMINLRFRVETWQAFKKRKGIK